MILFLLFVILGCTSKRGIIELHTRPFEADIYVDEVKQGRSPVIFEYDFCQPATLTIEKIGYYPETEALDESWVFKEVRKGNYREGDFMIQGETVRTWKVTTLRLLQKK